MMNISSGKWVIDSQLLVYTFDKLSPFYQDTQKLFSFILEGKLQAIITQQNIIETERVLLLVYKRKPQEVVDLLEKIIINFDFKIITPVSSTYLHFHELLSKVKSMSVDLFDYYLAATMLDNGINCILTVNTKDFAGIKEIKAVNPFKVK